MKRPDCFEFAMDFLGHPEDKPVREYVEQLELQIRQQRATLRQIREWYTNTPNDPLPEWLKRTVEHQS